MKKRPRGVTLLSWLVLSLSAWNFIRFGAAIFFWQTLKEYHLQVNPAYISISGAFWGLTGIFLFWSLRQGKPWTRIMVLCATVGYASWYWFDRLVLQPPRPNWPFSLVITVILLLFHLVIMVLPNTRQWFKDKTRYPGDIHEQS